MELEYFFLESCQEISDSCLSVHVSGRVGSIFIELFNYYYLTHYLISFVNEGFFDSNMKHLRVGVKVKTTHRRVKCLNS